MQFASVLVTGADLEAACRAATVAVRVQLGQGPIDFAMVFASPRYGAGIDRLPVLMHDLLGARTLVGCSGAAVTDHLQAIDNRHALVLLAGRLPAVQIDAVAVTNADLPSADAPPQAWRDLLPPTIAPRRGFLVLGEPFHFDAQALLAGLDFGFPGLPKVGGIASGSRHPDGHTLFLGRNTLRQGAVIVSLAGEVQIDATVAPGCRPFGRRGRITRADRNRLVMVDDRPARQFVADQLAGLEADDRGIAEQSPLFLGIASDPFAGEPGADEFLIRHIIGQDESGNLVVADAVTAGRTVQLHMRDSAAAGRDLRRRLAAARADRCAAALLFRCLGRDGADHATFAEIAGPVPMIGCHCNGEIATLGSATFLHGYTAVLALLRPRLATKP
jgi:small ligand-binding sensory domain FIST